MNDFKGFPAGKVRFTFIPAQFFTELLPLIDHLGELKVTLYFFWRLGKTEGAFRYLRLEQLLEDDDFMQGMGGSIKQRQQALSEGIEKAVTRGTLISSEVEIDGTTSLLYFLNSARGQAAVKAIESGNWQPSGDPQYPITLDMEKPNIFLLYEQHIGPLTPMIAESLREAEGEYPAEWIEDAFRIAVENNVRNWRYIYTILENWKKEGKDARRDQRDDQEDRKKYIKGKFSDHIQH
jgi:DNA replication protein